jgi:hypothetical protein
MVGYSHGHLKEGIDLGLGQAMKIQPGEFVHLSLDHRASLPVSSAQAASQVDDPGRRKGKSGLDPRSTDKIKRQAGREPERE